MNTVKVTTEGRRIVVVAPVRRETEEERGWRMVGRNLDNANVNRLLRPGPPLYTHNPTIPNRR